MGILLTFVQCACFAGTNISTRVLLTTVFNYGITYLTQDISKELRMVIIVKTTVVSAGSTDEQLRFVELGRPVNKETVKAKCDLILAGWIDSLIANGWDGQEEVALCTFEVTDVD